MILVNSVSKKLNHKRSKGYYFEINTNTRYESHDISGRFGYAS